MSDFDLLYFFILRVSGRKSGQHEFTFINSGTVTKSEQVL